MPLDKAHWATLKADILANTNTIPAGQEWTGAFEGQQIKDLPMNGDADFAIAGWYSQLASPAYRVWRNSVTRSEVYHSITPEGTVFNWATFKAQVEREQTAWIQMFMGDSAPFHNLSFRDGVFAIFSGSAAQNNQRAHIFNVGRKAANRIEKLLSVAPIVQGGISPTANNGNTLTDALGSVTNPAVALHYGGITANDVSSARNS